MVTGSGFFAVVVDFVPGFDWVLFVVACADICVCTLIPAHSPSKQIFFNSDFILRKGLCAGRALLIVQPGTKANKEIKVQDNN